MRHLRPAFFKNRDHVQVVVLRFGDIAVIGGASEQVEQGGGGVGVANYKGCAAAVVGQHGIYHGVEGEAVVGFEGQRLVGGGGLRGFGGAEQVGGIGCVEGYVFQHARQLCGPQQAVGTQVGVAADAGGFGVAHEEEGSGRVVQEFREGEGIGQGHHHRIVVVDDEGIGFNDGAGDDFRVFFAGR